MASFRLLNLRSLVLNKTNSGSSIVSKALCSDSAESSYRGGGEYDGQQRRQPRSEYGGEERRRMNTGTWIEHGRVNLGPTRVLRVSSIEGRAFVDIRKLDPAMIDGMERFSKQGVALSAEQWRKMISYAEDIDKAITKAESGGGNSDIGEEQHQQSSETKEETVK